MKFPVLVLTGVTAAFLGAHAFADDKAGGEKCDMMKKHAAAPSAEQAELNKLVTEMNSNVGDRKIEAMAAILTRLVAQANEKAAAPAPAASADGDAAKAEAHHH